MMISSNECERKTPNSIEKCKICSGKGIIEVFRDDLEEFEEVVCACVK
jgi:hypothetical protein